MVGGKQRIYLQCQMRHYIWFTKLQILCNSLIMQIQNATGCTNSFLQLSLLFSGSYSTLYMNEIFYHKTCLTMACIKQHPHHHFTSSLDIRYRKVKLWGIHSIMLFRDFPAFWHFLTLFLKDSGNDFWIISKTPPGHKSELFANDSIIFGRRILWSLRTPKVARTYSSFAASSSWNNLLGVYTRTWKICKCKYSSSGGNEFLFSSQKCFSLFGKYKSVLNKLT